jgi:hypothetical protein
MDVDADDKEYGILPALKVQIACHNNSRPQKFLPHTLSHAS